MNTEVKHSNEIPLDYLVISEDDVLQFAEFVQALYTENCYRMDFHIYFDGNSKISGNDVSLFSHNEFKRKKVVRIEMEYYSEHLDNHFRLELLDTTIYKPVSCIKISSTDMVWYNSTTNAIYSIIKDIQPQNKLAKQVTPDSLAINCVWLTLALTLFTSRYFNNVLLENNISLSPTLVCFFLLLVFFSLTLKVLFDLSVIYPRLSLDFGPAHKRKGKKLRTFWAFFITTLLIPLLFFIADNLI